jgi:plastocyanin
MRVRVAFVPAAALLLLSQPPAAAAAPHTYTVVIDKMKFGPTPPNVKAGDTILWVNRDLFRHTATAANGSFNIDLPAGKSGKTVIRKAGTTPFTCKYHPGMRSVLKVAK